MNDTPSHTPELDDMDAEERLARTLAAADGMVWWTTAFPGRYRTQARLLMETDWMRTVARNALDIQPGVD